MPTPPPSVRRTCSRCRQDQTPLRRGIHAVCNPKGHSVGLFCEDCIPVVRALVEDLARCHGAYIVAGRWLASPRGTPNLQSVEAIEAYLAARRVGEGSPVSLASVVI